MILLDEWGTPERRPAHSLAAALSLVAGVSFYQVNRTLNEGDNPPVPIALSVAPAGTAVADLQYLDKYSDLLQNFDALDYMDGDAYADAAN
jgi:hypothetical protein